MKNRLCFLTLTALAGLSRVATAQNTFPTNGNVGIGTTTPQHQLTLGDRTDSDGQPVMLRSYGNTGNWQGGAAFGGSQASVILGQQNGQAWIGGHNGTLGAWSDLIINAGGGHVGIGRTSHPNITLDVDQVLAVSGDQCGVNWNTSDGKSVWALHRINGPGGINDDLKLLRYIDGTFQGIALQIQNSTGHMGIGRTSHPNITLDVDQVLAVSGAQCGVNWNTSDGKSVWALHRINGPGGINDDLKLLRYVDGTFQGIALQVQQATGNVGIGTENPQAKLDVAGDIRIGGTTLSYPGVGRIAAGAEVTIQSAENNPLYLNPFHGGDVFVGSFGGDRTLRVIGKVVATTLELTSDRNVKQDFRPVSPKEIAAKVAALPVTTWAFTNSPNVRHIGWIAQDLKDALPDIGVDDKHIGTGDADGVLAAAFKGLYEMVQEKESRIAALEQKLAAQEQSFANRLAALEKAVAKSAVQQASFRPEAAR